MNNQQQVEFMSCTQIKMSADNLQDLILNIDQADQESAIIYNTLVKKIKLLANSLNEIAVGE